MIVCTEFSFDNVHFEVDALVLINALNSEDECLSRFGSLVEEAKYIFKNRAHWFINFFHWEGNEAAHLLAKFSLTLYEESV